MRCGAVNDLNLNGINNTGISTVIHKAAAVFEIYNAEFNIKF